MVPSPARRISCRLVVSYAGFENESVLLQELYNRGMAQPLVGPSLHAGDGILCFWSHEPIAPWQTPQWLAEMRRSLRPAQYLRMLENRFTSSESSFVDLEAWDSCVDINATPVLTNKLLPIYVGIDASHKHDSTAIVACSFDLLSQRVRLIAHRIFQPSESEPIDFETAIEATVLDLSKRFLLREALFDPWQLQAVAQRLTKRGIPITEFPQTSSNLTASSQNLYELIEGRNLIAYPDAAMRLAVSRAVATETPRGWKISKTTQSHKIDVVIALAQAAYACMQNTLSTYDQSYAGFQPSADEIEVSEREAAQFQVDRLMDHIMRYG